MSALDVPEGGGRGAGRFRPPWHAAGIALVLGLAAVLRLSHLGVQRYAEDIEGQIVPARAIARGEWFPLIGQELSGLADRGHFGPAQHYLAAIPHLFTEHPLVIPVWLSLLLVLAVWATWRLGREAVSPACGVGAALLAASYPFLCFWARHAWNASYNAVWFPIFYWLLWRVVSMDRSRSVLALLAVVAVASHYHLLVLNMLPAALAAWIVFRPRLARRWLLGGIVLALATYAPWVAHGLLTGNWDHALGWVSFAGMQADRGTHGSGWPNVLASFDLFEPFRAIETLVELDTSHPIYRAYEAMTHAESWAYRFGLATLLAASLASVVRRGWRRTLETPHERGVVFLLLVLGVECLALLTIRTPFWDRHYLSLFPLPFLVIAAAIERAARWGAASREAGAGGALVRRSARAAAALGTIAVVSIAAAQSAFVVWALEWAERRGVSPEGDPTYDVRFRMAEALWARFGIRDGDEAHRRVFTDGFVIGGIPPILDYLARTRGEAVPRAGGPPREWRVVITKEVDSQPFGLPASVLSREEVFERFLVYAYPASLDYDAIRLGRRASGDGWTLLEFDDRGWEGYTYFEGRYADGNLGVRIPYPGEGMDRRPLAGGAMAFASLRPPHVVIDSRACLEKAWVDGRLFLDAPCPRERRMVEHLPTRWEVEIPSWGLSPGRHLLALSLYARDKAYELQIWER